jgi:predicted RNase H-like nuclease (RuvC/YqgF family)
MAITAVRNGSCSMGAVALDDLEAEVEAGEDEVALEAGVVMLAEDESGKSSQQARAMVKKEGERYILPHSCF